MEKVEAVIVGGGVIGLSIARALHLSGFRCLLLERNSKCGMETSSRNSEVIHSGIYYPPDSVKSSHCIQGRELLLPYLKQRHISFNLCGKLIVANETEVDSLVQLYKNGLRVGLTNLRFLRDHSEVTHYQPTIVCKSAVYSPYTGVFDSHMLLESLQADILETNTLQESSMLVTDCEFLGADCAHINTSSLFRVETSRGSIETKFLINSGGLSAAKISERISCMPRTQIPKMRYAKGSYFKLCPHNSNVFNCLVYPMPVKGGLGIHTTIDTQGGARFGPNVEWIDNFDTEKPDYSVNERDKYLFIQEISRYWPSVEKFDLIPDYSGIRPKAGDHNDFLIQSAEHHRVRGLVNLFGIESPGLTSSFSIAETIKKILLREKQLS